MSGIFNNYTLDFIIYESVYCDSSKGLHDCIACKIYSVMISQILEVIPICFNYIPGQKCYYHLNFKGGVIRF